MNQIRVNNLYLQGSRIPIAGIFCGLNNINAVCNYTVVYVDKL
jgi:hypothetical protein